MMRYNLTLLSFSNNIPDSGAKIEAKDYRGRTPLLLAAELDRSVAASALMDLGASAKVCFILVLNTPNTLQVKISFCTAC